MHCVVVEVLLILDSAELDHWIKTVVPKEQRKKARARILRIYIELHLEISRYKSKVSP